MMWIITATALQKQCLQKASDYADEPIFSWQEFMVLCAKNVVDSESYLLNSLEERVIWQRCLKQFNETEQKALVLFAKPIQEAFQLLFEFEIPIEALNSAPQSDVTQKFLFLIQAFKKFGELHKLKNTSAAFLQFLEAKIFKALPKVLVFYGFLVQTPLQKKALALFQANGIEIQEKSFPKQSSEAQVKLVQFAQEIEATEEAIAQIFSWHQANPHQKIALVSANLSETKALIANTLVRYFKDQCVWSIQQPQALIDFALTQVAILFLKKRGEKRWRLEELLVVLNSPYWGDMPQQMLTRAKFIESLRTLALDEFDAQYLLALAKDYPELEKMFASLSKKIASPKKTLRAWFEEWQKFLSQLNFANAEELGDHYKAQCSHGNLVLNTWQRLPEMLDKYFSWHDRLYAQEALGIFEQICQQVFVSREKTDFPIQILKPLDALTQNFDRIIWLDVTDNMEILPVHATPFIPKKLQKSYGLWNTDFAFNNRLAESCYNILRQNTDELYLFYFCKPEVETQSVAAFCQALPWAVKEKKHEDFVPHQPALLTRQEVLFAWQKNTISGSTAALKAQALCDMQAFAKYRLKAQGLPEVQMGLTALEKGLIVHRALQLIWQQLKTQAALMALSDEALAALLMRTTELALQQVPWVRRKQLPKALFELERACLIDLLKAWLQAEMTRPPFQVYAIEKDTQVLFAKHKWRIRIDRIDQLADGRLLLIDYKTGATAIQHCLPDQLREPQLPFYAITESQPIAGIAFAEISFKKMRFSGFAESAIPLGELGVLKAMENWEEVMQNWQLALTQLTESFVTSQGVLNPCEGISTCQRCGLQSFCRVFEGCGNSS